LIEIEPLKDALALYEKRLTETYAGLMRLKLGFQETREEDRSITAELLQLMAKEGTDYTRCFRRLCDVSLNTCDLNAGDLNNGGSNKGADPLRDLFIDREACDRWVGRYCKRTWGARRSCNRVLKVCECKLALSRLIDFAKLRTNLS